jgi:hypothetical protein
LATDSSTFAKRFYLENVSGAGSSTFDTGISVDFSATYTIDVLAVVSIPRFSGHLR